MEELPLPDPDLVRAARRHLTARYATGVEALLWEMHKHPMHDLDAIWRVLRSWPEPPDHRPGPGEAADERSGQAGAPLDIGAAFTVLMAARQDVDRLEAALFDQALQRGLTYEQIAAVLELPDAEAAGHRHRELTDRSQAPVAERPAPLDERSAQRLARGQAARERADEAARRARKAERRRQLLTDRATLPQPDSDGPALNVDLFWEDPEVVKDSGLADTADLAARRTTQANLFHTAARMSAARAHLEAAQRHDEAAAAEHGDVAEHRRQAAQHRRDARNELGDPSSDH